MAKKAAAKKAATPVLRDALSRDVVYVGQEAPDIEAIKASIDKKIVSLQSVRNKIWKK